MHSPAPARTPPLLRTIASADGAAASHSRRPRFRCRIAQQATGTGTPFLGEVRCLLRHRLKVAALLFGTACGVFLLKYLLWDRIPIAGPRTLELALQTAMVATAFVLVGLLGSGWQLTLRQLRAIELSFFGLTAAFFGWLHYVTFAEGHLLTCVAADQQSLIFRLATAGCALRWILLVVTYGTFIPNTWRRCAVVVGLLALVPLALTLVLHAQMGPNLGDVLLTLAILMTVGSVVAVFGSYKIAALSREAFEARQLGQYRLKRLIGSGGMGEVHLAEHVLLRRPCALKLVRATESGDPAVLSRFEREVRATATLTHPNTVEIFDFGQTEAGTFYYVMEYLPGLGLDDLVERHGPLPARAVYFLRQVCGALREAHGIGLIHRDVKPSNILACERGGVQDVAKLLDFGLVQGTTLDQPADRLTIQGTILGSPPYMSPEQAAGKPLDARSDIYSVGGVAYFLLTGQPPFLRDTAMQMLLAHAYEPVVPLANLRPEVPADLQDVILRCLEKAPERRFQDARSLERALAACACAGEWGEDQAADWWREHRNDGVAPAASSTAELGLTSA